MQGASADTFVVSHAKLDTSVGLRPMGEKGTMLPNDVDIPPLVRMSCRYPFPPFAFLAIKKTEGNRMRFAIESSFDGKRVWTLPIATTWGVW